MDKIREILAYKFWILLALALIVPVVGWWFGAGEAESQIASRKSAINGAYSAVPKSDFVNEKWVDGVVQRNKEQQEIIDQTWEKLAEAQLSLKTWPPEIAEYMAKIGTTGDAETYIRDAYSLNLYQREWGETWLRVNPVREGKFDEQKMTAPVYGIVDFDPGQLPYIDWGEIAPTTKQMRDAQEDIWLYRSLLDAIAAVNRGLDNRSDAVIPQINSLELLSGFTHKPGVFSLNASTESSSPAPGFGPSAAPAAPASSSRSGRGDDDEDEYSGGGGGGGRSGFGGRGAAGSTGIDQFVGSTQGGLDQLFVPEQGGGAGRGGLGGGRGDDDDEGGMFSGAAAAINGATTGGTVQQEARRYVEDTPQYRTRAFTMTVRIDHQRLPELLASLSDSPWPIKILKVDQWADDSLGMGGARRGGTRGGFSGPRGGLGGGRSAFGGGRRGDDDDGMGSGFGAGMIGGRGASLGGNRAQLPGGARPSVRSTGSAPIDRPTLVTAQITGTMRIYKTKAESVATAAETDSQTGFGAAASAAQSQETAEAAAAQSTPEEHEVRVSERTPELDDSELFDRFKQSLKAGGTAFGTGGGRRGGIGGRGRRGDDDDDQF